MKFLKYIFVFFFVISYAQNYNQFTYRLEYVEDSISNFKKNTDFVLLNFQNEKSYFVDYNYLKADSLFHSMASKELSFIDFGKIPKAKFKYMVEKNLESQEIYFYNKLIKYKLVYEEFPLFDWKIVDENKTIGELQCKKAILNHYGRTWTAWFTEEIPINDGPYKFSQLPGLIVQIYDLKKHYNFELIGINKGNTSYPLMQKAEKKKYKKITKEAFNKTKRNIEENIINEMSNIGVFFDKEGENRVMSNIKSKNNPIELED